jgi:small multidrug resistance pump
MSVEGEPVSSVLFPRWLRVSLVFGGIHSIFWGCAIILLPEPAARVYGLAETPRDLFLWQGTGLVLVLFGVGYLIAATDPGRHWAVVCIGLVAKVLGPIGMLIAVQRGEISADVLWLLPVNDIVWWLPFGIVVRRGIRGPRDVV